MIEQSLLATAPAAIRRDSVPRSLAVVVAFGAAGAACGVAARAWMRLISAEPEFTWSGTLFIVGLFTVVGIAQGCALAVRRRGWPRWAQAIVRVFAAITALLLGAGAGSVMILTLVCAPLAIARTGWRPSVRVGLAIVAALNAVALLPLLHNDLSWPRSIVGWMAMLVLYGAIVTALSLNLRPLHRS